MLYAALPVAACTSPAVQTERPALIVQATAESRAELLKVVRVALHDVPLLLADDALTRDSILLIEPRQRFDAMGLPVNGRALGMPERFLLSVDGRRCVLTQERTRQRWVLERTQCKARD